MASIDKFSLASSKLYKPTKLQRKAVKSFLSKSDTFVCLPTGYGKSYIYQLSLLTAKQMSTNKSECESSPVIVVVCPLNSLIADQIRSCEALGLSAVKLESSLEDTDKTDIVFVSPEKLDELETKKWLSNLGNRLVGVFVDESHCVVNWGSSEEGKPFREAYGRIGNLRGFTKAPILCLTATAGAKMRRKIIKSLMMKKVNIIHISPEKENINIAIKSVKKQDLEETLSWLVEELKQLKNTTLKTIVYCGSLKVCGELYSIFDEHIESDTADQIFEKYHSKTPCEIQEKVLESFTTADGKTRIVFARSALGMGVDIPNIERVIHFGIAKEMGDYVQEIGRCGRDGGSVWPYITSHTIWLIAKQQ
ncbi:ATP-dependent DNA helicase Q-like 1 [Exaiptasia diaphana]|uniref:DNA 3'-5' helicase n=1 Tax=Exaiptasia diaphana TaxID=2652724 RepID=A0A913WYC5_EXADI|nr:ATP-dependent DNA helicase Q-like 1 [Exaiptasia diaphana]KXJ27531.1 ATP-dependent DNA helicase Q-like 1 [Exaiptasia diaphana]